jgi:glycerophosphoryl diester phosphodiesterase
VNLPLVIGHRGACGYRPENTMVSFQLAIDQGADGVEFDVVTTLDDALIIRHENALSGTTDVSLKREFSNRRRDGSVDGNSVNDWFTEDFSGSEIATLRAIERVPEIRPGSAKFDGQFQIPDLKQVLEADFLEKRLIVAEIKDGSHLEKSSVPISKLFAESVAGAVPRGKLVIESFNREILEGTRMEMENRGIAAEYFYLLDSGEVEQVKTLLGSFDGISISLSMLFSAEDWVKRIHDLGKKIWVYTARAEQAEHSIEEYYLNIIDTGVDGIFADQPDLLRRVLADRSGSAYDY